MTGWHHASQSKQNARSPYATCERRGANPQSEEERDHAGRPSRHVAGLFFSHNEQSPEDAERRAERRRDISQKLSGKPLAVYFVLFFASGACCCAQIADKMLVFALARFLVGLPKKR
jgi:hypothetical protein